MWRLLSYVVSIYKTSPLMVLLQNPALHDYSGAKPTSGRAAGTS